MIAIGTSVEAPPAILLVEDNPGDVRLTEYLLQDTWSQALSLDHATSVSEAVAQLRTSSPQCVLLDLSLPDGDGLETLTRVKEAAPESPIIVFTGLADEEVAVRAVQEGAQDYLIKGEVDAPLLRRVIRYAMERKQVELRLAHEAVHDPLTGLPNRALLVDHLTLALARSARHDSWVAVMFLDLDHFKLVNDSLGHAVGDQLLIQVAARLEDTLRPSDTVARLSGDEFVILCEDVTSDRHAEQIAARVNEALSIPYELESRAIPITASIGIAMTRGTGTEAADLLRDADTALYRAKRKGRGGHVMFEDTMRRAAVAELDMEADLPAALERDQFCLFYQPIVDLRTGRVIGAEALLRWNHPRRGLLPPAQFLPFFERTGLILPLGAWVVERACRQAEEWRGVIPGSSAFTMWVNVSARQLSQPDFADAVAEALGRNGTDPAALLLEITEHGVMNDADAAARALWSLRALGVKLAVDDFGTGYSSLVRLREFPLHAVKVDRSFVAGLGIDPENEAIVRAVIDLAHAMGLTVVAEGVETEEQLSRLRDFGCDSAQGFLFARPGPPEQIAGILRENPTW